MHAGQLRVRSLPAIPQDPIPVSCMEGAVRIASFSSDAETARRVTARLEEFIKGQQPDGAFAMPLTGSLCVARAAFHAYLWQNDRRYLACVNSFLTWCAANYDRVIAEQGIRRNPADLIELAIEYYRYTLTPGSLRLLAKLRRDATDWSVRLRTFDTTRPVQADDPSLTEEIRESLRADAIADGLRGVRLMSEYSGNGTEAGTGEIAWPKIRRWHGAVCGGTTGTPYLAGPSPAAPMDPSVIGAWAEAMATCASYGESWAVDEAERLFCNAVPAAACEAAIRVNQLGDHPDHKTKEETEEAAGRLLRGTAALLSTAVLRLADGFRVLYPAAMTFGLTLGGQRVVTALREGSHTWILRLQPENPVEFNLEIRVPSWAEKAHVILPDGKTMDCKAGTVFARKQLWKPGDEIRLAFEPALQIAATHHQGRSVFCGSRLMALPASSDEWAYALESAWIENDEIKAKLLPVKDWKLKNGQPADVPVLPETAGEAVERTLVPFAETRARVALFAGCRS